MKKENIGSSFDDWLREEGIYIETSAAAVKRVFARQISQEMVGKLPRKLLLPERGRP
jgi:hypothetical protein